MRNLPRSRFRAMLHTDIALQHNFGHNFVRKRPKLLNVYRPRHIQPGHNCARCRIFKVVFRDFFLDFAMKSIQLFGIGSFPYPAQFFSTQMVNCFFLYFLFLFFFCILVVMVIWGSKKKKKDRIQKKKKTIKKDIHLKEIIQKELLVQTGRNN